jgi:hypothetical protein
VPEVPRAPEVLRKKEEAKPAAAAAPAANLPGERAGQQVPPVPEARRAFDVQQRIRGMQAPAPAPAPGASGLRESAPAVSGADAVSGIANRIAAPEAERTPEKWLEDIRQLRAQGKTPEAEREFAEFRKRYPEYRLPEDFR